MKIETKYVILNIVILFFSVNLNAQEFFDDDIEDNSTPPAAPIDGYSIVSLIAGAAYGFQKLKNKKKAKTNKNQST